MTRTNPSKSLFESETSFKNIDAEFKLIINSLDCFEDCYFSMVDATGKIVFISKGFEDIDGYKINDILGKNVLDVYKLGKENSVHVKAINEKKVLKNTILRYTSANGHPIEFLMDIYPVFRRER